MASRDSIRTPILPQLTSDVLARFWAKVEKTDGCWLWTASKNGKGYGNFGIHVGAWNAAHRMSFIIHSGQELPSGVVVCHKCDNPACVRPDHLFLGTQSENMRDAFAKGRLHLTHLARGQRNGSAKLTEADVVVIRKLCAAGESRQKIAEDFGISKTSVSGIWLRKSWAHVA